MYRAPEAAAFTLHPTNTIFPTDVQHVSSGSRGHFLWWKHGIKQIVVDVDDLKKKEERKTFLDMLNNNSGVDEDDVQRAFVFTRRAMT